jgi:uncharacterized protein (TIGR02145 family)
MIRTLIIAFILIASNSAAQQLREFNISEMSRPEVAVVQANAQFSDDALILFYSALEGLEFRSSLGAIDKVSYNSTASRYEVLVKPKKQLIFVAKFGFIEQKVTTLNPNPKEVLYFKVEEKKDEIIKETLPGKLSINSDPSGADIYLNGFKVADKTPFTFELNSGSTKIKLKKKKFEDFDTTLVIQSNKTIVFSANLNSSFLFLNVTSDPTGAYVFIDGEELGRTPFSKELDLSDKAQRGFKSLQVEAENYESKTEQIPIVPSTVPLERTYELQKLKSSFTIKSTPSGASVYIDDTYKGITPYTSIKEYGTYKVYVQLDDFRVSEKKPLVLSKTGDKGLEFNLRPLTESGEETEIASEELSEIKIGKQVWMIENLNVDRFRNGELISNAVSDEEWKRAGEKNQPAWCYYNNDPKNGEKFGRLYNWYAVVDSRGLCPAGWHVSSDAEWTVLTDYLGGESKAGGKMKATTGWYSSNSLNGNQTRFSGLPGGYRDVGDGTFYNVGYYGYWWSSSESSAKSAWFRYLYCNDSNAYQFYGQKRDGLSVRCIKDL